MTIRIPDSTKQFSVPNTSDLFGNIWYTKSCSFDEDGYIKLSSRSVSLYSKEDDNDFNTPASFGRSVDANFRVVNNGGFPWIANLDAQTTFDVTQDVDSGVPTLSVDSRGIWWQNRWYVTTDTGLYYKSGSTWTNAGISLTSGKIHSMCVNKAARTLCIADGNAVVQINTSHSTTSLSQLTIPSDYEIVALEYNNNKIGISTKLSDTVTTINEEAYFFVWTGSTSNAQQGYGVGSDSVLGMTSYKSSFVFLTRTGNLMYYNGGGVEILDSFPCYSQSLQMGNQSIGNIMKVEGDRIYINMSNNLNAFGNRQESYIENFPAGIWCYDPKVRLYHRYAGSVSKAKGTYVSSANVNTSTDTLTANDAYVPETGNQVIFYYNPATPIGGTSPGTVYYVIKLTTTQFKIATTYANAIAGTAIDITSTGAALNQLMFFTVLDYGISLNSTRTGGMGLVGASTMIYDHIFFGGEYTDYDGTAPDPTLNMTVPFFKNIGYLVTVKMPSDKVSDMYKKLYIKHRPLKTDDKIIVKCKTKDILGIPVTTPQVSSTYVCTWTSTTTFTTQANIAAAKSAFDAGEELECEIIDGAGAGQMSKITNIQLSGTTYTVTVEDVLDGAVSTYQSNVIINNYKFLGEITSANTKGFEEFAIGIPSPWIKLKVILQGYETTIEELQIINANHLTE